jgi:hypothetical protein
MAFMAKRSNSSMKFISLPVKGLAVLLFYFSTLSNASANLVSVQNLGTTYVDNTTPGGPWVLLGYGANGNLGSLLTATNGTFDSARQGSATLNALAYARSSAKLAISWNQTGKPNGGITSYTHAVAFSFADPSLLTLTAAATPSAGSGSANWSKISTDPSTVLLNIETLHGNPNLPSTMYARRETFGARYGGYYGFANSTTGNNQLDWGPDTQAFTTLFLGTNANGFYAGGAGGTQNGYVPSTMAIWAKMPTSSNQANVTYTFTNAGATGRDGPTQTQVNTAYAGTNLANSVTINTQGIQEWTVPTAGVYSIEAWGAGGDGSGTPGKGAKIIGTFTFDSPTSLKILVGHQGEKISGAGSGGGGGGTYVVKNNNIPLIVAGAGSGVCNNGTGGDSTIFVFVDLGSQDGTGGNTSQGGGSGAGFRENGGSGNYGNGGASFLNGGVGGSTTGGFGGGGSHTNSGSNIEGGGGGFDGGDGNTNPQTYDAKGGTSLNTGTDQNNTAGANAGHGKVVITRLTPPPFELNSTTTLSIAENQSAGTVLGEINATASDNNFTFDLSVHTSQADTADTGGGVNVAFQVNGSWTSGESFFTSSNKGDVETKTFTTVAKPTKLKFTASSGDAWGCWKIVFAGTTVLLDSNGVSGSSSGTAPYWVDGDNDQGMPTSQEHVLPSPAYVFSLVDGDGSTGNSLFTLESNGILKTATILDYEANASHSIRVRATDELNASVEKSFDVNVTDDSSDNPTTVTYTFSNAGTTGREGPTQNQVNTAYAGTNLAGNVTISTQGIQEWTVPATGDYRIEAWGAQGGAAGTGTTGGLGAHMSGNFALSAGNTIKILIGQLGGSKDAGGGGGGGSFVITSSNSPLIIAGGGGGGNGSSTGSWPLRGVNNGGSGQTSTGGQDSNVFSADHGQTGSGGAAQSKGGTDGHGGGGGFGAAGGGGFLGDGGNGTSTTNADGGKRFLDGGNGGSGAQSPENDGGYGGGGGGANLTGYGGGGGGYSGGGGGQWNGAIHGYGGGGGSFNSGTEQNNTAGANTGHGKVIITSLATSPLNSGLVAWYPLDGNGTDQSTTANHATVHGATPTADRLGVAGKALLFDGSGSNNYLEAPFNQAVSSHAFSYSIWAKPTATTTNYGSPITFRNNGRGFNMYKMPNNTWSFWTGNGGWQKFHAQTISLNWTALAFTHDGTTGKCYQNGVLVVSSNKSYLPAQSGALKIGAGTGNSGPTYFFKGALDEVRIWNRVLSAQEISSLYTMEKPANFFPSDLNSTAPLAFSENVPAGSVIGEFNATDPDANATLSFSLIDGNASLFSLDANGTMRALVSLDYETDPHSHLVRIRVTDEHNASLEGNFTIALLNQIEDLDGDGTEDHYDTDDDGDGFSDSVETAYGSDPRDPNSVANAAPTALDLNGSSILENQPAGTLVGHISATDSDSGSSLSYHLVSGTGDGNNSLFSLDANGTLRTLHSFDYETNSTSYAISVRVTDEHNASLDGNFTISLLNQVEDLDGDGIEDHYDPDDDGDGFPDATESSYGSDPRDPQSVANAAPNALDLNGSTILENQPAGTLIGNLSATDPDAKAILSFSIVDANESLLSLDANGTLRTLISFDFESNAPSHSIRFRVTDEHNASLEGNFTIALLDDISDNPSPESNATAPVNPDGNQTTVEDNATAPVLPEANQTSVESNSTVAANADGNQTTVDQNATVPAWWEADADSGNGWRASPWLGSFRPYSNGWIYHLGLGWAYAQPDELGGLWLWMPNEQWVWSAPHCWPHIWKHSSTNWLYFVKEHEGKPALYDYSTESFRWK